MINLGDVQLGAEIPFVATCTDGTSPAFPTQAPVLSLFSGATLIRRVLLPIDAQADQPGVFRLQLFLNSDFPVGPITGFVQWRNGGLNFCETVWMRILPGGDPAGSVISLEYVRRPQAGVLLWETDAGTILKGTNPRSTR